MAKTEIDAPKSAGNRSKSRPRRVTPATIPGAEPEARAEQEQPPPPKPARAADRVPRVLTFFQQVERIPKEDWGTRASIKLYRLEPVIDRLRTTDTKYIGVYAEPCNEERIKLDHGSGRYRLYLNYKLPATQEGRELDSMEFDILDQAYPPKIAAGEWLDSPHNKKWQWAKEIYQKQEAARAAAEAPPQVTPAARAGEVLETIRAVKELMPGQQQQRSELDTFRAYREMFPPPPPQTENHLLTTVVGLFTAQLTAAQNESKELRAEIREMRHQPAQPQNNGIGTLKELVGSVKELLPTVKELFPGAGENIAAAVTGRSRMGSWQEFLQPVLPELVRGVSPMLPMLASAFFNRGNVGPGIQPNPAPAGALPPARPAPPPPAAQDAMIPFLNSITPAMLNYLTKYAAGDTDFDGAMFFDQLNDMFGPVTPEGVNWHESAKQAGVVSLVGLYQRSPYWARIGPIEPKFIEFLTQFLAADASATEDEAPETIDLTAEEGSENAYA